MADPVFGYSTLQIIPSLDGASKVIERELSRILGRVGPEAGRAAGEGIAEGIAASDSDVAAAARTVTDAASRGASSSGQDLGRRIGGGVADGVESVDIGAGLSDRLRASSSDLEATGQRIGREGAEGVEAGLSSVPLGAGLEDKLRTTDLTGVGQGIGAEAGAGIGDGILDGVPDLSGGLGGILDGALGGLPAGVAGPALAAGAAVGALLVQGFGDALAKGQIVTKLEAGLGVAEGEAARLGKLAGKVYADNFGDSAAEVGDAVATVRRSFTGLGDISDKELERVTKAALTTAKVFDEDVNGAVRAASQLIRTGLAKDSTQAFDIITKGLQGPANGAQDLLDTFTEYSTQFRELGLEGEEALGLIQQGVLGGARDADVAADALKEFAIRAQDGSDTTIAGFEALDLSWQAVQDAIAGGGPKAAEALDTVLDRLRGVEDPAERAQIAVQLFGTQSEDMADALNSMDLSSAVSELGKVEGSAQAAQDAADDLASNFTIVRRKVESEAEGLADAILAPLAEVFEDGFSGILTAANFEDFVQLYLGPFGSWLPDFFHAGEEAGAAFREGTDAGAGIGAGRALAEDTARNRDALLNFRGGIDLYRESALDAEEATFDLATEVEKLSDRVQPVGSEFELAALGAESFRKSLGSNAFAGLLSSALDVGDALITIGEQLGGLGDQVDIGDIALGVEDASAETVAILEDVLAAAVPLQERIASVFEFSGEGPARAAADSIREDLMGIFEDANLSEEQITELLDVMNLMPEDIETAIRVSGTDVAIAQIQLLQGMLGGQLDDSAFAPLQAAIAVRVNDGDFETARELLFQFQQDMADGSLDNPILLALNGDTTQAEEAEQAYRDGVAGSQPTPIPLTADPKNATSVIDGWRLTESTTETFVPLGADMSKADKSVNLFGDQLASREFYVRVRPEWTGNLPGLGGLFGTLPRRANGGPLDAGQPAIVGEKGWELWWPDSAGQILNQQQVGAAFAPQAAGREVRIDVYETASPRETAEAIGRKLRRGDM